MLIRLPSCEKKNYDNGWSLNLMPQLISLIYASSATKLMSQQELTELLKVTHKNNPPLKLTGLLLYNQGNFIQALEGPEETVLQVYQKIQKDPRHHNIILLGKQSIEKRQFPNWAMGFRNLEELSPEDQAAFSDFMTIDKLPDYFQENPSRASVLLTSFKNLSEW